MSKSEMLLVPKFSYSLVVQEINRQISMVESEADYFRRSQMVMRTRIKLDLLLDLDLLELKAYTVFCEKLSDADALGESKCQELLRIAISA